MTTESSSCAGSIEALLVGGPTLRFRYGRLTVLTDPTFDAPGSYPGRVTLTKLREPAVSAVDIGAIDLVLLSHDRHADNLDTAGRLLLKGVPRILSTPAAAQRIPGVTGLAPWQAIELGAGAGAGAGGGAGGGVSAPGRVSRDSGAVRVRAVPALHGPAGAEAASGPVTGFVLAGDGLPTVYVSGDNASVDVVREIADRMGPVDVAVLFGGAANVGRFGDEPVTLSAERMVEATRVLEPAVVIPVHVEGWAHLTESRDDIRTAFEAAGLAGRLRLLTPGVDTDVATDLATDAATDVPLL